MQAFPESAGRFACRLSRCPPTTSCGEQNRKPTETVIRRRFVQVAFEALMRLWFLGLFFFTNSLQTLKKSKIAMFGRCAALTGFHALSTEINRASAVRAGAELAHSRCCVYRSGFNHMMA
jgi:hypothetical protein